MKIVLGLGVAVAAALLAACSSGSGGTPSSSPASASASPAAGSPTGAGPRGPRGPAASGTIAEVSAGSIEVQSQQAGQVTVTYTAKTAFSETASTTRAAVTAGSCVVATAPSGTDTSSHSFAAASVFVSKPTNGQCRQALFGGPRGSAGTGSPRAFPSGVPTRQRPSGFPSGFPSGRAFGSAANGKVTGVSGSTITVSGTDPRTRSAATYTVTLTSTTKYSQTVQTTAKALAVGKCASAEGKANDAGAVAATSIRITPPVNGTCEVGFGGRRATTGTSGG